MTYLLFTGSMLPPHTILRALYTHGYHLLLTPSRLYTTSAFDLHPPQVVVVALDDAGLAEETVAALHQHAIPWLGWNTADDPALTLTAYAAGARAVLPAAMTAAVLFQSIQQLCIQPAPMHHRSNTPHTIHNVFRRGDVIHLQRDAVLDITDGVVAQTMLHPDGHEVLMGLSGPGQILLDHPDDVCCLQLYAHTDATVVIRSWHDAGAMPHFSHRLRERIRLMEAWSAMQAHPHFDQRILGILSVLAEQFGVPHPSGLLIDVRITHAQLAAAVGATRSTVTRLLNDMRTRGELATIAVGERERFCLSRWERTNHM